MTGDFRNLTWNTKCGIQIFGCTNWVVNTWNSLPNWIVYTNTTNMFKSQLVKFGQNQEIMNNFAAQLHGTGSHSIVVYKES